jgi:hypothetical protein
MRHRRRHDGPQHLAPESAEYLRVTNRNVENWKSGIEPLRFFPDFLLSTLSQFFPLRLGAFA